MTNSKSIIGVDIAKHHLDAYHHQTGEYKRFANDEAGVRSFLKWARQDQKPAMVIIEPSGSYEYALQNRALTTLGIEIAKVNAQQIRDFARAKGRLAKTDEIDAMIIAEYGAVMSPRILQVQSPHHEELGVLVTRRRHLTKTLADEKNRLEKSRHDIAQTSIERMIAFIKEELKSIEKAIKTLIKTHADLSDIYDLACDMRGIGPGVASTLIAELPELGRIGGKQISSLVGVAPHNVDSGMMRGQRSIKGGRSHVRKALYMAALTARRYDGPIKDFYTTLIAKGKKPKVALVACMRKIIVILNAKIRDFYAEPA